jgi:DNA replicative helicase MCM subunit Mcm2 (Cdc46/Mcm family)
VVEDVLRFSMAFARCELCGEIQDRHFDRATALVKTLIGQTFRDGVADPTYGVATQKGKIKSVKNVIQNNDDIGLEAVAERSGLDKDAAEEYISKLKRQGDVYEPKTGEYRHA